MKELLTWFCGGGGGEGGGSGEQYFQVLFVNDSVQLHSCAFWLFFPDACLDSLRSVQVQRDRVYDQLVEYVGGNTTSSTVRRVSELLLMLPFLVQNKFICRDFWLKVLREKQVTLHKLLREMLEYVI